ncbi:MAG: DNA polymerase IV [Coriobacteriia bacterium]|nr:DNA polymerase IV [Coriobacteriia bacterium]
MDPVLSDRIILHVDMNSFYASVEQAEHPELRGKPVVVGGEEDRRHGIVLTKSIEAKPYGIKTAEALWEARQKCPGLIVLPPHYHLYKRYSKIARAIYYDYTDLVEPFGLDENWLDITSTVQLHGGSALLVAREISERIKAELGVTVSIGIGWDKITAKFGSDYKKPDAITQITRENYREIFWGAPVRDLLYVGRATERKLHAAGIETIGQLAHASDGYLQRTFGKIGFMLRSFARGEDTTTVKSYDARRCDVARQIKSYGNGLTAPHDITCERDAKALIYLLAESVAQRLREGGMRAKTVAIAVRDAEDLTYYTRQMHLGASTAATMVIADSAWQLLVDNQPLDEEHAVRGLAVRVTSLIPSNGNRQLSFFKDHAQEDLDHAIDGLRQRFGNTCIQRGIELTDEALLGLDIKNDNTVHPVGYLHR